MADRNRCHCGGLPVTIDGFCADHKHQTGVKARHDLEQALSDCKNARHWLNEQLLIMTAEAKVQRLRVQYLEKMIMLVRLGDADIRDIT